jgi:hypothetical protein
MGGGLSYESHDDRICSNRDHRGGREFRIELCRVFQRRTSDWVRGAIGLTAPLYRYLSSR